MPAPSDGTRNGRKARLLIREAIGVIGHDDAHAP